MTNEDTKGPPAATRHTGGPAGGPASAETHRIDETLGPLLARRDRDGALRLLMGAYGTVVYRYIRGELRDATNAEDVLQKVFIEVHRDVLSFAGRSSARTWIFGIARHRVLDALKKPPRKVVPPDVEIPDPGPAPDQQLDDARLELFLRHCLTELDETARSAVLLRYQQGMSFEEMATVLKEKAGTLQARVARSLPVLRKCIEKRTGGRL